MDSKSIDTRMASLRPNSAAPRTHDRTLIARRSAGANEALHAIFHREDDAAAQTVCRANEEPRARATTVSLVVADEIEASRLFARLAEGGQVVAALTPTFFAARFGIVVDRSDTPWIISVPRRETAPAGNDVSETPPSVR